MFTCQILMGNKQPWDMSSGCLLGQYLELVPYFSWPPFPSPQLLSNQLEETCLPGWRARVLAPGCGIVAPSGVILWESPPSLSVGIIFPLACKGRASVLYLKYSKLIICKSITYTGYLRDTMLEVSIYYQMFVYYYEIRLQMTRKEQLSSPTSDVPQ